MQLSDAAPSTAGQEDSVLSSTNATPGTGQGCSVLPQIAAAVLAAGKAEYLS